MFFLVPPFKEPPTTMDFPTKNDHFGMFWGYHHLRQPPYMDLCCFDVAKTPLSSPNIPRVDALRRIESPVPNGVKICRSKIFQGRSIHRVTP